MRLISKTIYLFQKYKEILNVLTLSKYVKKNVTFAHGNKRGGMATCIVISLNAVFFYRKYKNKIIENISIVILIFISPRATAEAGAQAHVIHPSSHTSN